MLTYIAVVSKHSVADRGGCALRFSIFERLQYGLNYKAVQQIADFFFFPLAESDGSRRGLSTT